LLPPLQAAFYHELPPTVDSVRKYARQADLSHPQRSPPPHSIRWWASNCLLLYFAALQWVVGLAGRLLPLVPAAAAAAVSAPSVHRKHVAAERAAEEDSYTVMAAEAKRNV
jgi:hypothetical protein